MTAPTWLCAECRDQWLAAQTAARLPRPPAAQQLVERLGEAFRQHDEQPHAAFQLGYPVLAVAREVLAALQEAPAPAPAWQPIANPPETAETVLLSNGFNVGSGFFAATDRKPRWHNSALRDFGLEPTHWQPLPPPPDNGK